MTATTPPPRTPAAPAASPATPDRPARPDSDVRLVVPGIALAILSALLLAFAADVTVVGHFQHARAQQTGYAELRERLALGTAPVGQTDIEGRLLDTGTPVALLRIRAIGLREVVFEGTASGVLMSGPGHRRDTVLPGQPGTSVVMGRQWAYGGPFRHLDELAAGDEIEITTGQGEHTYRVTGTRSPGDPVPEPPASGQGRLTLVTATGGPYTPAGVLRVDAELVTDAQPAPARVLGAADLAAAEDVLTGDQSAWTPAVLWAQALLLAAAAVTWALQRWGRWQAWITGVPVVGAATLALTDTLARLLPNLL
ncbi:sortase [Streptomyces hainanensis]|uniref:Class E sortase n=1 Tax=Streptomyces hainanensis TaxID=402648 RepID=A0A4R4TKA4_9ACTN|nr:class E sortase [Streptomyces hainanensis]TDC74519.1 class E sortase [Streptomyces hainanensis]